MGLIHDDYWSLEANNNEHTTMFVNWSLRRHCNHDCVPVNRNFRTSGVRHHINRSNLKSSWRLVNQGKLHSWYLQFHTGVYGSLIQSITSFGTGPFWTNMGAFRPDYRCLFLAPGAQIMGALFARYTGLTGNLYTSEICTPRYIFPCKYAPLGNEFTSKFVPASEIYTPRFWIL